MLPASRTRLLAATGTSVPDAVMLGLDPSIHVFFIKKLVDGRAKPGHDT
ncbi:hypothetical protein [Ferrovibrio sp.]|nr:hypothetical protein [Ferrovibrio sp.]